MKFITVEEFCKDNGYTSRKMRYEIMSKYFGISEGTLKDIISFDRYLRDIIEVDAKGIELERAYHKPSSIWGEEYAQSKKLANDLLKYS